MSLHELGGGVLLIGGGVAILELVCGLVGVITARMCRELQGHLGMSQYNPECGTIPLSVFGHADGVIEEGCWLCFRCHC